MYKDSLAHWYDMSTPVGLPDLGKPGGNPGVGVNIVSNPPGMPGGRCAEFNGDDSNVNCGDIVEVNAVEKYTMAWWMNQDVLDVVDNFYEKKLSASEWMWTYTHGGGNLYVRFVNGGVGTYGYFDYSTVVSALTWHHIVVVFDGSQTGDAARLVVYVDAVPMILTFIGPIPATSPNLAGADFTIGSPSASFDGKLDSFGIFTDPLTRLQVTDHRLATMQGRL